MNPAASQPDAGQLIRQESVFGRLPLLPQEREYGPWGAHATCFAYAVATWCFLIGGYAASWVGAVQGIVCLIGGNLVGVFLTTMPLSLGCQRYGLEQIEYCKSSFGQRGSKLVLVFYIINMLGWTGLILVMFGNGIRNIVRALGYEPAGWVVGAGVGLGLWLSYLLVTRGVHLLNITNAIIAPGLGLLSVFMFYMLIQKYGWQAILQAPPLDPGPDPLINYFIVFEMGVASGFSWWGGIGFLARNTRKRRDAVYPEILQLGLFMSVVCCVSLFSALVVKTADPTEWMVPLGGVVMGVLALIFVALANVTSSAVSLYATGLSLRHLRSLRFAPWWVVIAWTIVPCLPFVFWPHDLYDLGDTFLAYNGTMYAPLSGILFADYFFLRKQRLNLWSLFDDDPKGEYHYSYGFNWVAVGCLVLGQFVYLSMYNPLTSETHYLFRFMPASMAACVVPGLVYWGLMRILNAVSDSPPRLRTQHRRLNSPNI
ncbi:MAG: cytosine permease [Acidobacteriota bacterium]|nr:cytosine permease [Acidobacteriota bacterium]